MTDNMDKTARECGDHAAKLARENERLREVLGKSQGALNPLSGFVRKLSGKRATHIEALRDDIRAALNTEAGHD